MIPPIAYVPQSDNVNAARLAHKRLRILLLFSHLNNLLTARRRRVLLGAI